MAYNTNHLDQLLERYFAGETNLDEEKELRRRLRRPDLPDAYRSYATLFAVWEDKKEEQLDAAFFQSFEQALQEEAGRSPGRRLRPVFWLRSAAAVLLMTMAGYWLWSEQTPPATNTINWAQYEPETPEEAFRIYRKAMYKLSGDLHKGTARAAQKVDRLKDAGAYFE